MAFETLYAEPSRNGIYKTAEHHGAGVKIVNMGELFAHEFVGPQEMSRLAMSDAELEKSGLLEGDLLFGRRSLVESGAGKCSLVEKLTEPTTFESSIIRVRPDQARIVPRFFYYWFRSPMGRGSVRAIVSGTNVKGIRGSDLKSILVPVPDKGEQRCIADTLAAYDDLIDNNRRRIKLLEESARLLYREWFVHLRFPGHEHVKIVDGVPEGWERKRLIDLADMTMGQSPTSDHYNKDRIGFPFHQGVSNFGERFVEHETWCDVRGRMAAPGDILFSVRAPVGRLNLTRDELVLGRGLAAMRSRAGQQSMLFYQLATHFFKEDMIGGGAIFASVTKKDLENQLLMCPTSDLEKYFNDFASEVDAQIATLTRQIENLRQARDLLLPRLMSGEVTV